MSYICPRCGNPIQRSTHTTAGLVSFLLHAAFGSFQCKECGTIPMKEFPKETRSTMIFVSALFIVGAIAVAFTCIWLFLKELS